MAGILALENVSKVFPSHRAVDDVSLSLEQGEFHALVGPSGCGKTTTLRMVAGFEQPTRGAIRLEGHDISGLAPYQRNVSTVFQNYALFPHLTVRENVEFGLKRKGLNGHTAGRVEAALAMVQLDGKMARKPAELSGGEKQRAALARSLVLEPAVLLLDEPLSALDPNLRKQVRAELKDIQRRVGITFLMVTHDQEEALSMADRITVMNRGRVEQTGPPADVYLRPATAFVAQFLGAVNWVGGVGIRPEATRIGPLAPPDASSSSAATARPAVVRSATFLGNCIHVEAQLTGGESVVAEVSRFEGAYAVGDHVHVWWHPQDELRFE